MNAAQKAKITRHLSKPHLTVAQRDVNDDRLLYIIQVVTRQRRRLLGYIGRRIMDRGDAALGKTFGRKLYPGNTTQAGGEWRQQDGWQFVYVLCSDIISPERKFLRSSKDADELTKQRAALQRYMQREKIDVEAAHRCTLKYNTRRAAKEILAQLPSPRRRQVRYRVVPIKLQWGKPYTASLLSNRVPRKRKSMA